jgi:aminopeptidase N
MEKSKIAKRSFLMFLLAVGLLLSISTSGMYSYQRDLENRVVKIDNIGNMIPWLWHIMEDPLLDSVFRIDIDTITVTFDYVPESHYVDCQAKIEFTMRRGQRRPVIHLAPAIRDNAGTVNSIQLNNETLNLSDESDVRIISFNESSQQALEFQRNLGTNTNIVHILEIFYQLTLPGLYPRFSTEVNDLEGRGNEERFPTINTPHELARHILTFRVHSNTPFRCIGSGFVEKTDSNIQEWTLDTEREVASYTVMFALLPQQDTIFEERNINGVDVRVLAFVGGAYVDGAFDMLEQWLPELEDNLGSFPMPRGLSVFLTSSGGGMEYYGATITSLYALMHEVFHMYYGCSTVNKTYRDSWLDEAINVWYELSVDPTFYPMPDTYSSNIVSGRSPAAVGFDRRAYNEGAHIMEAVARELGGRNGMIAFLRYVHSNYSFSPFTTLDFLDYLEDYSGVDMTARFLNWLFQGEQTGSAAETSSSPLSYPLIHKQKVDMTPPQPLLQKYSTHTHKRRIK